MGKDRVASMGGAAPISFLNCSMVCYVKICVPLDLKQATFVHVDVYPSNAMPNG